MCSCSGAKDYVEEIKRRCEGLPSPIVMLRIFVALADALCKLEKYDKAAVKEILEFIEKGYSPTEVIE